MFDQSRIREHMREPIRLGLQRASDRSRIQSSIDGRGTQTAMIQDVLNRGEILSGNRKITGAGAPEIMERHIVQVESVPEEAPLLRD